ncbi:hypothetical protein BDP55DRAFT_542395 [Colletotrichum godetiae]|uniref:Oxidase ustYa n=1 Tax=Colletotrichum godetiae TaxID=1209918 RepID=A0AAJ0EZ01_9PEZI|nr:uncharacterized protein BDP55DRAFT_542395 [Colletotrichum godetiae]KAK1691600.1 hypothetical protein BDP55DRAFT_542395 [Colletotrichum godetiae]
MENSKLLGRHSSSDADTDSPGFTDTMERKSAHKTAMSRCEIFHCCLEVVLILCLLGTTTAVLRVRQDYKADGTKTWPAGSDYNHFVPHAFVRASSYDGSGPQKLFSGDLFEIAAFHQIHCLTSILEDFGLLAAGVPKEELPGYHGGVTLTWEEHKAHCFNYVRQALMCFADSTAEGHTEGDPHRVADHGVMHVCNDFDALLAWSKKPERALPKSWRVTD